jgi:hypothetical protein
MNILICCPEMHYYFAKICVASIRYYYPEIPIYLLKDELSGNFDTNELEKNWNVKLVQYPEKSFGLSAAKMFFYTDPRFAGQEFLVLDSDIVMIGRLLDEKWLSVLDWDIIASPEKTTLPDSDYFTNAYFNLDKIEKIFPGEFFFPGYTFNCGQLFYRGGTFLRKDFEQFFDFNNYPYWKRLDIFPLVDQSLFNFLFPKMDHQGKMRLKGEHYMIWSENKESQKMVTMETVSSGNEHPLLIHWAGALRTPLINRMTRSDILIFFENYYYSKVPLGKIKQRGRRVVLELKSFILKCYLLAKKVIVKK